MNNKQLALIIISIIAGCCIIAGAVVYSNMAVEPENATIANNTTNVTENITKEVAEEESTPSQSSNSKSSSSSSEQPRYKVYDDGFIEDTRTGLGAEGTQGQGVSHQWVVENYHPEL